MEKIEADEIEMDFYSDFLLNYIFFLSSVKNVFFLFFRSFKKNYQRKIMLNLFIQEFILKYIPNKRNEMLFGYYSISDFNAAARSKLSD